MDENDALRLARELQLEQSGSWDPVYFHGDTMRPFLAEGDELIVEPARLDDIELGDVVTYREELRFPTRRVIEVDRDDRTLLLRNDDLLPSRFYVVDEAKILGKVVARRRGDLWCRPNDGEWREAVRTAVRSGQRLLASSASRTPRPNNSFAVYARRHRTDFECLNVLAFVVDGDFSAAGYCLATIEEEYFVDFAHQQQLAGYLYAVHVQAGRKSPLAPAVAAAFRERYLIQWTRTERLISELAALDETFREAGEEFILLKGPHLAGRFYGDTDRREIWDIDILVRQKFFSEASRLVEACGFRAAQRQVLPLSLTGRFVHEKVFEKGDIPLDLHHVLRAYPGGRISEHAIWENHARFELGGCAFSVLSDPHALLNQILSVHQDIGLGTITLRGMVDLLMVLRGVAGATDWTGFLAERESEGTSAICLNVLALTMATFRCESRFPELTELLKRRSRQLVRPLDPETVVGLLLSWPLSARKAWAFRQYRGSLIRSTFWWLGGLPVFLIAHRRIFLRRLAERLRGLGSAEHKDSDAPPLIPTPESLLTSRSSVQTGVLRFGSMTTRIHFNAPRYVHMLGDLFRIDLQQSDSEHHDVALEIHLIEVETGQVPRSNGWFIRRIAEGPVQSVIVHRELQGIMSIYHDVAAAHVYTNEHPPRVVLPVMGSGQKEAHLLHCLMVVFYKLLFFFGRAHIHAAAVKIDDQVNLFYGPKGAGKSTICLSLGQAGGTILAEDHIVLRQEGDQFWASGCDGLMRVTEETERFFFDRPLPVEPILIAGTLKKELDLSDYVTCRQCEDMGVDRLFFPYVGESFSVRPISASAAKERLQEGLEERYRFANPADHAEFVDFFDAFTASVDCYDLEMSPNLEELPKLTDFLRGRRPGSESSEGGE